VSPCAFHLDVRDVMDVDVDPHDVFGSSGVVQNTFVSCGGVVVVVVGHCVVFGGSGGVVWDVSHMDVREVVAIVMGLHDAFGGAFKT
jgi:hypothetical protein